jgi:site-specific DNA-methyltransferase (adenine-specific)
MGVTRHWRFSQDKMAALIEAGRIVQTRPGSVPQYKRYLDEMLGVPVQNVWDDIFPINSQAQERLGYPTQKPEALLERILRTSSNEGDVVLDPFCGCGTAVSVAERLNRKWIGIDITYLAINLVQRRLRDTFAADLSPYEVMGAPRDLPSAIALKELDPFQFEVWAVDLADARAGKDHVRGADRGVDGYINFFDDRSNLAKRLIVQVKSGKTGVHHIRDLRGTMEREKAEMGALILLENPTKPMLLEAASAGVYEPTGLSGRFPRIQIRTIEELLGGKKLELPGGAGFTTFAKARRNTKHQQSGLF